MKKFVVLILIFVLFSNLSIASPKFSYETKSGELKEDEVWSGNILLVGDVLIPKGKILEIKEDTVIFCSDSDVNNLGLDPGKSEIIVYGKLKAKGNKETPILIASDIGGLEKEEIVIIPEKPDTEKVLSEWKTFKWQYMVFWSIISALVLLR